MDIKKNKPVRPPVKANMMIIRGLKGREIRGESWSKLEHQAYMELPPKRCEGSDSYFDLVLLIPGMAPVKCEAVCYRGCNCLAVPSDVVDHLKD